VYVFSIGDFARLTGVSVRMLRHYDEIGLVPPAAVDPATGYRRYSHLQITRVHRVLALKAFGFSLTDVRRIADAEVSTEQLRQMLHDRRSDVERQMVEAQNVIAQIEHHLAQLEMEETMSTRELADGEVTVKSVDAILIAEASATAKGFGPNHIGPVLQPLYPKLFAGIAAHGLKAFGPTMALYYDAPEGEILVSAATQIEPTSTHVDGLTVRTLPALTRAATVLHHGSVAGFDSTYVAMLRWIDRNGLQAVGYSREVYLDCPADMNQWVTEFQFEVTDA
jgi:DNA-binding transcriptional MerR regulator/effector-binding domain-containing protein